MEARSTYNINFQAITLSAITDTFSDVRWILTFRVPADRIVELREGADNPPAVVIAAVVPELAPVCWAAESPAEGRDTGVAEPASVKMADA